MKGPSAISILFPILAMGLPISDTAMAIFRRWVRNLPLSAADRRHVHHLLIGLGLNLLLTIRRGATLHVHAHEHGAHHHLHAHVHPADGVAAEPHHHPVVGTRRPFLVGLVHGLAGSAALMLAVLATIPSPTVAFAYIAIFGIGSIGGMMIMSTLLGLPFALAGERFGAIDLALRTAAGIGSIAVGLLLAWEIGTSAGFLA